MDFDSPKKINLINRIKNANSLDISIQNINLKKDTDTVSRYIIYYHVPSLNHKDSLKLEISYRNPPKRTDIQIKNNISMFTITKLIDNVTIP
ncbi:hypothetical protein V757_03205 [Pelistega indica]|uniref:Uncharacterized protein n=1 Tax=Pelistega indica TaxID=1414851 RepID=V8G9J9_9BURK|nr:hypothetical protein V757_03205 [Pelistega indica]